MDQTIVNECWRSISGFIDYQVSNLGRVRSVGSGKILTPCDNGRGYDNVYPYKDKKRHVLKLHRLVAQEWLDKPLGDDGVMLEVDHVDRNKKNNQVTNLRWATRKQNIMNWCKQRRSCSSVFKGVSFHGQSGKWRSTIKVDGVTMSLGLYQSEEEAASAYNAKAFEVHGEYAYLNPLP